MYNPQTSLGESIRISFRFEHSFIYDLYADQNMFIHEYDFPKAI